LLNMAQLSTTVGSLKKLVISLILLILLAAGTLLAYDTYVQAPVNLPDFVDNSVRIAVIVGFWVAVLLLIRRSKPALARHFGDQPAIVFQVILSSIAILVMIFAILRVVGVSPDNLLVGAGIVTLTVGLILSTFIGSFLNGALVFATHRFRVGDNVVVNNVPGKITEITVLATRIRTDVGHVAIPNGAVASGAVIITKVHAHEFASLSRLPYAAGDRVVTTYMPSEGTVLEITPLHTKIQLDSGRELLFLNSSVLSGAVAVARISKQVGQESLNPK